MVYYGLLANGVREWYTSSLSIINPYCLPKHKAAPSVRGGLTIQYIFVNYH